MLEIVGLTMVAVAALVFCMCTLVVTLGEAISKTPISGTPIVGCIGGMTLFLPTVLKICEIVYE